MRSLFEGGKLEVEKMARLVCFFLKQNSGKDGCFFCVRGKFPKSPGWENPWNLGAPKQNQWLIEMIAWRKNPRSRFRFSGFSDHFFTLWGCYVSIGAIEKNVLFLAHTHTHAHGFCTWEGCVFFFGGGNPKFQKLTTWKFQSGHFISLVKKQHDLYASPLTVWK